MNANTTPARRFSWVRRLVANRREEHALGIPPAQEPLQLGHSIYNWAPEDNASTRAMISDSEDYVDIDVATASTGEDYDDPDFDDDDFDRHSRYPLSSKSTAITSVGSTNIPPIVAAPVPSNIPVLFNPGVASIHSSLAGPTRNDSASVITIASSSRDWRRRRSIDTNVSTNAIPPNSVLNNPI